MNRTCLNSKSNRFTVFYCQSSEGKIIYKISFMLFQQRKYRYHSNIIQMKSQGRTVRKGNANEGSCRKGIFNSKGKRLHSGVHGFKVNL